MLRSLGWGDVVCELIVSRQVSTYILSIIVSWRWLIEIGFFGDQGSARNSLSQACCVPTMLKQMLGNTNEMDEMINHTCPSYIKMEMFYWMKIFWSNVLVEA